MPIFPATTLLRSLDVASKRLLQQVHPLVIVGSDADTHPEQPGDSHVHHHAAHAAHGPCVALMVAICTNGSQDSNAFQQHYESMSAGYFF